MPDPEARRTPVHVVAGSGQPLLLLHGLSGSGRWWSRSIPAFAEHFRTYSVDLPGFGASRATRWMGLDATADWLAGWMDGESLGRAHLAGHSLGGAVAARLALRHPGRVARLVLVDAAIRTAGVGALARAGDVWNTMGRQPPGFVPMLVRDLLRTHPWSFVAAMIDALQCDWETSLARITAPTLVVWGERDPITPIAHGRRIAAAVPGARLAALPHAGHNPMWECPEAFNDEVLRFLSSEAAGAPARSSPELGGHGP